MKVKVLARFRDKHNGKEYREGEMITVSEARYKEILTVGKLVEPVEQESPKETKPKNKKASTKSKA